VITGLAAIAAANQAESTIQQTGAICFLQSCGSNARHPRRKAASAAISRPPRAFTGVITKCPNWAEFRGFVLNVPLSSSISR